MNGRFIFGFELRDDEFILCIGLPGGKHWFNHYEKTVFADFGPLTVFRTKTEEGKDEIINKAVKWFEEFERFSEMGRAKEFFTNQ